MKIVVLNGSPKGRTSVTMQYVRFLEKKLPAHAFTILDIAQDLRRCEDDPAAFAQGLDAIAAADVVLWAFPVYVLLVHAHYKRFIELIGERQAQAAFRGKYAAALSTSIRFFDHTAHNYIHGICDDLEMQYWGGYSADMYDLLQDAERQRVLQFAESLLDAVARRAPTARCYPPLAPSAWEYVPGPPPAPVPAPGRQVLVVTDAASGDVNLQRMVARLGSAFAQPPEVINLQAINIRGGCLGCIQCGLDNQCVYREADDVIPVYRRLMAADVLVLAGTVRDRYLSARWKLFFDRGFFHNHVPMFVGKQLAWLVSGPLGQLPNLRQMLDAYAELQRANLVGIVTDEGSDAPVLDQLLDDLARRLAAAAARGYVAPPTFLGVAGAKLFRDAIWGSLRFVFHADHDYYRRHGLYDFPRRSLKTRVTDVAVRLLVKIPAFRREFLRRIKTEMVKPLEKVVDDGH